MSRTDEDEELEESATNADSAAEAKPRKRRAKRRLPVKTGILLLLLAALAWFAPSIIALTPLRQQLVPLAAPKLAARVTIGSASLGWLSPVRLSNVAIQDAEGQPLAEAPAVVIEKSLVGLLLNYRELGTIRLDQPHVHLALREGGSNLEDAINPFLEGESTGTKISCRVEVAGGIVELRDAGGNQGRLDEVNGQVDYESAAEKSVAANVSARAVSQANKQGVLKVEATWKSSADPKVGALGSGSALIKADRVALDALSPALVRIAGEMALVGDLTCDGRWEWSAGGATQAFEIASFDARNLGIAAPAYIGRDELRCESLQLQGQGSIEQGRVQADKLALECDFGSAQISGGARLEELAAANLLGALTQDNCRVKGRLDLARLAKVLPATLKIREGTQITSGELAFNLSSQEAQGRRQIEGKLETSNLTATNAGRRISWEQPILLSLLAHDSPAGPVIEQLEGTASFLRLSGKGSLSAGSLTANGDLDKLARELGQFVDLDEYQLAGRMQAGLTWKQGVKDAFSATGDVNVENFSCNIPGARAWRESRLTATLAAAGALAQASTESGQGDGLRLDTASLKLRSGSDELDVSLTAPVESPSLKTAWPLKCRLVGSLTTWLPRVQVFVPLSGWAIDGAIDLNATATASTERVEIEKANLLLTKLQAWGNGLYIQEPEMLIETSGTWDHVKGELTSSVTTLAGSAVALRADNLVVRTGAAGLSVSGDVDYRGDLAGLYSWTYDPRKPASQHLFGGITGKLKLQREGETTRADVSATFNDLVMATRKSQAEGLVRAVSGGDANPWQAHSSGQKVALKGNGAYDHRASAPAGLEGAADLGWTSALVQGLAIPQGELSAKLNDGLVVFSPLDLALAEGRLRIKPQISLKSNPMLLTVEKGRILEQVRISPEMCNAWLKYVAPLLADATQAEGRFTLDLTECALPLLAPETGKASGALTVHEAQVGPGPLGQQALWISQQVKALVEKRPLGALAPAASGGGGDLLRMPAQQVDFQLVDGRVHHQNLTFLVRDVTIKTKGSVGVDQTLSMVAEIPVLDRWIDGDRLLAGLKGQTLHIPITGTLSQPKLDNRALEEVSRQMVGGAAKGLIEGELNKSLQKLFGPKK